MGMPLMRMPSHLAEVSHWYGAGAGGVPVDEMGGGEGAASDARGPQRAGDVTADGAFAVCAGHMDSSPALGDWLAKLEGALEGGRRVHQTDAGQPTGDGREG